MNNSDCNVELEQSVIGGIMLDNKKLVPELMEILKATDFSNSIYGKIYAFACTKTMCNEHFDHLVAVEMLKKEGFNNNTAMEVCMKCVTNVQTRATIIEYAKLLLELSRRRKIKRVAADIMNSSDESKIMVSNAIARLNRINSGKDDEYLANMQDAVLSYIDELQNVENSLVDTGYRGLDRNLMGMFGGDLIILAARPGCGKSAFAIDVAVNNARNGKRVLIFSQEMKREELIERMVAAGTGIKMDCLIQKFKNENEENKNKYWDRVVGYSSHLAKLPVWIYDNPYVTPEIIRNVSRKVEKLSLIIVDYLQLVRTVKKYGNRNLEVGDITRELKLLAMSLNVPIVLLSQLNRGKQETDKPSLTDLRDSGEIEQNANKVMMIWKTDPENGVIGIYIPKNRRGKNGTTEFYFDGEHMRYEEIQNVRQNKQPSRLEPY